jgi:DNA-binding NarL/FixJ family response regulator
MLLRTMRGSMDSTSESLPDTQKLGRRECDVLTLSARGMRVDEVVAELGLAEEEVRAVLASARAKLGARSKLEAVLIALRRGDIEP